MGFSITKSKIIDFQRDKLSSLLLRFSIPCIISLLIAASYNLIDQIIVGNSALGINGSSAVGIVFPLLIFSQGFSYLVGDGCSAYLAICQGRGDTSKIHKTIGTGILITLLFSIILALVYIFCGIPILKLFQASDNYIESAYSYLRILAFFLPIFMIMNMFAPIIRTDGFPAFQMIDMGAGAIVNIILDLIFVNVCKFGIEGAAWATVIGQSISVAGIVYYLFVSKNFRLGKTSFIPDFKEMKIPLKMGLSSFITQVSIVLISLVSNIVLAKYGAKSSFGADNAIAACLVETKVFTIVIDIVIGLSFGAQPIIGYNIGAGNLFKVKKTYRTILLIASIIGGIVLLLTEICPQVLFAPFGGMDDPLYVKCATECFRIYLASILISCILKVNVIFFQSCGKANQATAISLFRDVFLFICTLVFIPMVVEKINPGYGVYGVFFAPLVTDSISLFISLFALMKVFQLLSLDYSDPARVNDCKILTSKPGPIIAISREHGSEGKAIAKALATKLSIPYYYKDIVFLASKESGLSSNYIYHSLWNNKRSLISSSYVTFNIDSMGFEAEEKVLNDVADSGSCVILERGASYYLRNRPNLVSVYIYADEETKLHNVMKKNAMCMRDAQHNIKKINNRRSKYYKNISNKNWGKENYNLAIDSSDGNIDRCVDEIIKYIENTRRN